MPKISDTKKQARKQIILDAALKVFGEKGFAAATLEDIMKCSGLSKGGIYTYFKSKEEIFMEIAEGRFLRRQHFIKEMDQSLSADLRIEAYMRWVLSSMTDEVSRQGARFTFEFWSFMSRSEETRTAAAVRYTKFEQDLMVLFDEGIKTGVLRKDLDCSSAIYMILTTMDGMAFADAVMGIALTKAVVEQQITMVMTYLRGEKGGFTS